MNKDLVCSSLQAAPVAPCSATDQTLTRCATATQNRGNPSGWPLAWERTVVPDPAVGSDPRPPDGGRLVPGQKCSRLRSQRPDRLSAERRCRQSSRPPVARAGFGSARPDNEMTQSSRRSSRPSSFDRICQVTHEYPRLGNARYSAMWVRCQGCRRACGNAQTSPLGTTWMASRRPETAVQIRRISRRRHPTARSHHSVMTAAPLNRPWPPHPASRVRDWERKWERRSAARGGQTRSDAVIVAQPKCSDVRQRR